MLNFHRFRRLFCGRTDSRRRRRVSAPFSLALECLERRQMPASTTLAIAATDASKPEGNIDTTPFTFTVTRSGAITGTSTVKYAVSGNGPSASAASASDFGTAFPKGTLSFAPGETSKLITVSVRGDTAVEPNEGFKVTLSSATGATIATATALGTILNDDTLLSLATTSVSKPEGNSGNTPFKFAVNRTGNVSGEASVDYLVIVTGTGPGFANADDFGGTLPSGTIHFLANETSKTFAIDVSGDTLAESGEGFKVALANATGALMGNATATGTIQNDDTNLVIAPTSANKPEGNSGTTAFTFTVTRNGVTTGSSSAAYAITGSTVHPADAADFGGTLSSGTVSFSAGQKTKVITVSVKGDTITEPDEGFVVTLSNPLKATLLNATASGLILNDDTSLSIAATDANKEEGNSSSTPFTFTVTRAGVTTGTSSVKFAVAGSGTHPANAADFGSGTSTVFPSGTVNFSVGESSKTITVNVHGDTALEDDEGFTVTLSSPSVGVGITTATAQGTIRDDDRMPINSASPQIFLTDAKLAVLRQAAADNTPQWQAFKQRLDRYLNVDIADDFGAYQGEELAYISDFALGYQILKNSDPRTAADYADKAISLMKSGIHDLQSRDWVGRQFLAVGDGTTKSFTLPNADFHPETLQVYLSDVATVPVVHGTKDGQDDVDYYSPKVLRVSNTSSGSANYASGVDWQQNGNYPNGQLDWSLPGQEPAVGTQYYVTVTSPGNNVSRANPTVNTNHITFATAPSANQAVYVRYIYGTHSEDGSTLDYQSTSAGDGGFNSIFVDTTYTSRYLGKHIAMGLDWLDGYNGFSTGLKREISTMLVRWADYLSQNGYFYNSPVSNYGAGSYVSLVMTALALAPRTSDGQRLLNEALDYRQQYVIPVLQNPTNSVKGGFWAEGWNYGYLAVENLLLAADALEVAGQAAVSTEHQWANEIIDSFNSQQPAPGLAYDGGSTFQAPWHLFDKGLFYVLSAVSDNATEKSYANYYIQDYPDSAFVDARDTAEYGDMLFHDPNAASSYWSAQPLQRLDTGTGLLTARSDWGDSPTWLSLQMGNPLKADHQNVAPGLLEVSRGADRLLINAFELELIYGNEYDPTKQSEYGNIVAVSDRGAVDSDGQTLQHAPFCMGVYYGPETEHPSPGVVINNFEGTADFAYLNGDYHEAYSYPTDFGGGGPTSALTRQVVFLRPDYILVYDHVTTTQPEYDKQVRWNFNNAPVVTGNSFVETVGGSKLFAQTFSTNPLNTSSSLIQLQVPAGNHYRVITQNTDTSASVSFLTVFQTAAASTLSMDATTHVVSADGRMEGAQIGNQLVLFGHNGGIVDLTTPITYSLAGDGSIENLLTNLEAGQTYQIVADGQSPTSVTASSEGTLRFTTPAGARSIQVSH